MLESIFIPGNIPSLKNSKVKTSKGIFPSKTVVNFLRNLGIQHYSLRRKEVKGYADLNKPNKFEALKPEWNKIIKGKELPLIVKFHFVRDSKRKFDFQNAVQIIADLLVAHDFIEEDDMDNFIPVPFKKDGKWYTIDKQNPGVYLQVT